jgi:hypothetical protein
MKKMNLQSVLWTVLIFVSFLSFTYVNTGMCSKVLNATVFTLPTSEQLPDGKTELPDIEFGKQLFLTVKKMLAAYF